MATHADDLRHDDLEFDPSVEPSKAKAWLNLLTESEDAFERYNGHCDNIDRQYANLERLANNSRDKEFQMFWANAEVIRPQVYAKPPIPAVAPKFPDRRPVYQAAAEMMERLVTVSFDLNYIDELLKLVRDDLALIDRGVAWCRYESGKGSGIYSHEKVCIDFKNRRDFLHSVSRNWREVTWVAAASYLTRAEARERFYRHSGDEYQRAEYKVDRETKEIGGADNRERAAFWEIWDKTNRRVLWVAHGCELILDEDDPHLDLRGYFPCPKPAYGTVQRGSLVPVPDVLQYKDQLEEINLLTGRIHALSDALEVKGFYPAGTSEIADAVQAAIAIKTPGRVLVPISNWAAFGGSKEIIIWLPIEAVAQTITGVVALRKEIIQDIYQIMGLSDIMRGSTAPEETLGAQQLKSEYGSTRIKDKQQEMIRLARDLVEITSEIITEKFKPATMIEMAQTQLPTNQMLQAQIATKMQDLQRAQLQMQQMAQQPQQQPNNPQASQANQQAQDAIQQGQLQIQKLQAQPTLDQVLHLLKDNRAKSFILDIETDSTIMADENGEKERRTEFTGVLGQLLPQLAQMIQNEPKTAEFCGAVLKFTTAPYRAGRELESAIDDLVAQMKLKADAPRGDDPTTAQNKTALQIEQIKDQTNKEKNRAEATFKDKELAQKASLHQEEMKTQRLIKLADLQAGEEDDASRQQLENLKAANLREKHQADIVKSQQQVEAGRQKADFAIQQHEMKRQASQQAQNIAQMKAMQRPNGGGVMP